MFRIRLALAAPLALLAAGLLSGIANPASAQVANKTVGAYMIATGWQTSPAYVGFQNAIQLFVNGSDGNGVDGLANQLKLAVSFNGQNPYPLSLTGSFDPATNQGNHGEYDAAIIPTAAGNYTFHVTGNIKGQPLDESFTSSDQTFGSVQDPSSIEFPSSVPTVSHLANTAAGLNSRVSSASSSSGTAIALGIAALVVAVVLGGAGLVLGITAQRRAARSVARSEA